MKFNVPPTDSSSTSTSKLTLVPLPSQLFSLILIAKEPPLVPMPAPALISPVGCSFTLILTTLRLSLEPSIIS